MNASSQPAFSLAQEAASAYANSDFNKAETLYTNAIQIDGTNAMLFANRSAAKFNLQNYQGALKDGEKSIELDASFVKGYYCIGIACQHLQQHNNALVAFAKGMSLDSKPFPFLEAMIDTALYSPLKKSIQPVMEQLKEINLDRNPFVVISVIGQDLLAHNHAKAAVQVLECAIVIDTCSLKLKGSVFSALSSALWTLEAFDRAIMYMLEDLKTSQSLGDSAGICRAHGNLGEAYLHQNQLDLALLHLTNQLDIAQKLQHKQLIAAALSSLGSVRSRTGAREVALRHHEHALAIFDELEDEMLCCKELGKIAQLRLALGDTEGALGDLEERLRICANGFKESEVEEGHAYTDISTVYKAMQNDEETMACLHKSASIFQRLDDTPNEMKTLLALGNYAKNCGEGSAARSAYERLLELSVTTSNKMWESRACANLGIVHHQIGKYDIALKFQAQALRLATELGDVGGQGRAYGNIGNAYSASGLYEQAVENHLKELQISRSEADQECECSTHGNLAVAYQALQMHEEAITHYKLQHELAVEIGNTTQEARSLMNLANFHNTLQHCDEAIELYRKYLVLPSTSDDAVGHGRALYNLGYAYFSTRNFLEAASCYEKSVAIATECGDKAAIARAYCNLGLVKKALGDHEAAIECQSLFLNLSTELGSDRGKYKALGNLGDIHTAMKALREAVTWYERQVGAAEECADRLLIAQSCSVLGNTLRAVNDTDRAVVFHGRECSIYKELQDIKCEYKARGRLGAALTSLTRFTEALDCYQRQLQLSITSNDVTAQACAWGNLAIAYTNLREHSNAVNALENQIEALDRLQGRSPHIEKCRAYCHLADCHERLDQHHSAVEDNQIALTLALELKNMSLMERSCKGLSNAFYLVGNLSGAVNFAEHRLKLCKLIGGHSSVALACGDLGYLYSKSKRFSDALQCLSEQMKLAVEANDEFLKSDAACGMGNIHFCNKDYEKAIACHKLDLELAQRNDDQQCQGRAHGNVAATYESMGDFSSAIPHREQQLFIAKEEGDEGVRLVALHGIGRNTLYVNDGDSSRSMLLLQQAMLLCHGVKKNDQMILTVHDLGIATWACGDLPGAITHFRKAVELVEGVCSNSSAPLTDPHATPPTDPHTIESFKLMAKCYSTLICALCSRGHGDQALEIAEKSRTFPRRCTTPSGNQGNTIDKMVEYAHEKKSAVVYYHVTAAHLFQWFIPHDGGVEFVGYNPLLLENKPVINEVMCQLRDSLGVSSEIDDEEDAPTTPPDDAISSDSLYQQMLASSRSYQYDVRHLTTSKGLIIPPHGGDLGVESMKAKSAFHQLYDILFGKLEKKINNLSAQKISNLMIVADNELNLIPFAMLKKRSVDRYLGERFTLHVTSSFSDILQPQGSSAVDHGRLMTFAKCWDLGGEEADLVGRTLSVEPSIGMQGGKEDVLNSLSCKEIIHFACPMSLETPIGMMLSDETHPASSSVEEISGVEECVLTMSDVLSLDLSSTKLVVLGAPYLFKLHNNPSTTGRYTTRFSNYISCLLGRGARSVLFPLWPVPETASKLLFQELFDLLAQGHSTVTALSAAMETLRTNESFEHPSYWAGFVLIGQDVRLDPHDLSLVDAFRDILRDDPSGSRDLMKLVLHLLGRSLKEADHPGSGTPTYILQDSVSSHVGEVWGWRKLFAAAGFHFRPSNGELPDAIFFPQTKEVTKMKEMMRRFDSFLSTSDPFFRCYGKLTLSPRGAAKLFRLLSDVIGRAEGFHLNSEQFPIGRELWQLDGVHELLTCLGFEVTEADGDWLVASVTSSFAMDTLQSAIVCLGFLFGHVTATAPSLPLDQPPSTSSGSGRIALQSEFALSTLLSEVIREHQEDPTDFVSSSHSTCSAPTVENNAVNYEEPKSFTQTPRNPDLVIPRPLPPQNSSLSTPDISASPGGAFTPTKKFQFASSLGNLLHSPTSSIIDSKHSLTSVTSSALLSNNNHEQSGDFLHGVQDPKVCVVSPQRDNRPFPGTPTYPQPPSDRYMSVLAGGTFHADDDPKKSSEPSTDKEISTPVESLLDKSDPNSGTMTSSSEAYKPSRSVASAFRTVSPQHDYKNIVDKLARKPRDHAVVHGVRSDVSTSHTAYRLVNQNKPDAPPTLQKFLVETKISTVSTMLTPDRIKADAKKGASSVPSEGTPTSIFKKLGALNIADERVQFV